MDKKTDIGQMKASPRAIELIKRSEGLRLAAYKCAGGVWTIGYGHTGNDVKQDQVITAARAAELLERDVARVEAQLSGQCAVDSVQLTQGQFDALVSFAFNLGMEALRGSTLWRKVKANPADPTIPSEFNRWVYAKGVKLPGLVTRRAKEASIYAGK